MKEYEQTTMNALSLVAAWWFYIALVLYAVVHAFPVCFSSYGMLFESAKEFYTHLMVALTVLSLP